MAVVARTRRRDYSLAGRGTLMARCLAAGLPVASACSGRGACGKCLMMILLGGENLEPASPQELAVLQKNAAGKNERLGCQCLILDSNGDVLITTGYW